MHQADVKHPTKLQQRNFSRKVLAHVNEQSDYWPKLRRVVTRWYIVVTATSLAVFAYVFSLFYPSQEVDIAKALAAIGAGIIFVLGYLQWILARHEASFEKFYDRSVTTIEYIDKCGIAEADTNDKKIDHLRNMRVFVQIDSIEYILGKYRLGFVEDDLIDRALWTFRTECYQNWFREKVLFWLGVVKEYHSDTYAAAKYIVAHYNETF